MKFRLSLIGKVRFMSPYLVGKLDFNQVVLKPVYAAFAFITGAIGLDFIV